MDAVLQIGGIEVLCRRDHKGEQMTQVQHSGEVRWEMMSDKNLNQSRNEKTTGEGGLDE